MYVPKGRRRGGEIVFKTGWSDVSNMERKVRKGKEEKRKKRIGIKERDKS